MTSTPFRQRLVLQVLARHQRIKTAGGQGFTLIELLVVIVILGVLGSVGYQQYLAQIARANGNIAQNTATAVAKNCAALATTGDQTNFSTADFLGAGATVTGGCNAIGTVSTFTATVGTGNNQRQSAATVQTTGAVTPGTAPAAPGTT